MRLKSLDDNTLKRLGCLRRGLACELQCQCRAYTELQRVVCSLFSVRSSMARTRGLPVYSEGQWRVVGKAAPRRDRPSGNNAVQKLALKVRWCVCRVVTSICKGRRTPMSRMTVSQITHTYSEYILTIWFLFVRPLLFRWDKKIYKHITKSHGTHDCNLYMLKQKHVYVRLLLAYSPNRMIKLD